MLAPTATGARAGGWGPVLVLGVAVAVPLSSLVWDAELTRLDGHSFDVSEAVTFGLLPLVAAALVAVRARPTGLELLVAALAGWIVVVGPLKSDSILTWGPPAARWLDYSGMFVLARTVLGSPGGLRRLSAAVALAFAVPALLGFAELASGGASVINGAERATAPGGRGPLAVAFAGQFVLVLGYALAQRRAGRTRAGWLATMAVGALGLIATATRITTITALAALAAVQAACRRWRLIAVVPLVFGVALLARPDLRERYFDTLPQSTEQRPTSGEHDDASGRLRSAVWRTIMREWRHEPVLGIGPGMTAPTYEDRTGAKRVAPHNDFIGVLAELGLIGIALFLALLAGVLHALWRALRRARATEAEPLFAAVLALFVAVQIGGALSNAIYNLDVQVALWALAGAAIGAAQRPDSSWSAIAEKRSIAGAGSWGAGGGSSATSSS
jgi:O-antigen ligase